MTASTSVSRHPIRGAIAGLIFGLGLALLLISFAVIALGTLTPLVVVVLGLVLGLVVALALPPLGARAESAPATSPPAPPADQPPPATGEGTGSAF